jgi:hypothetical protein
MLHSKFFKKQEQTNLKIRRRKEIISTRAEINEIEAKNTTTKKSMK